MCICSHQVSGNGELPQSAQVPGSSLPTRFEGLEVFLIEYYTEFNMTISDGNTLLYQESGSTVKYLSWVIPSCTPSGYYQVRTLLVLTRHLAETRYWKVTLYESSVINNEAYYTITTILVYIAGSSTGQCSGLNQFQAFQPSSPSPQSPWLTSQCSTCSYNPTSTTVWPQQSTASVSAYHLMSLCSTCSSVTVQNYMTEATFSDSESFTVSLPWTSGDSWDTMTLTVGERTTETVTFAVTYTLTETFPGFTTTATCVHNLYTLAAAQLIFGALLRMTMSVTTEIEVPTNNISYVGYIPVNAAKRLWMSAVATLTAGSLTIMTIVTVLL